MLFFKRHRFIIVIVLLMLLAIALVLWIYEKRIRGIDAKPKTTFNIQPTKDRLPGAVTLYLNTG